MSAAIRRLAVLGTLVVALGAFAAPAWGFADPLFAFIPAATTKPFVPPVGYLAGPCGLGVDSTGRLYLSDYYHHTVDVFSTEANLPSYKGQLSGEDPLDGPCGLALDSTNRLYVNNFDRSVVRFGAFPSFGTGTAIAGVGADSTHPTGVAVDPTTNDAYTDSRTYITGYDSSGAQLTDGAEALRIGLDPNAEYYGLAIDAGGRLYVADAASNTVKVYDPAVSTTIPVKTLTGPPSGFTSLRHSALAVDRETGVLYVVDDLQPQFAEQPRAVIDVFDSGGAYLGHLKYEIVDALPPGLAVDNSGGSKQGNVYVTSGNSDQAGIYGYARGSQTSELLPPSVGLSGASGGGGAGAVEAPAAAASSVSSAQSSPASPPSLTAPAPRHRTAQRYQRRHRHHRAPEKGR